MGLYDFSSNPGISRVKRRELCPCNPCRESYALSKGVRIVMRRKRDYYKYVFKDRRKIVHGGITTDLKDREKQHQRKWPKGHILQVGHRTTEEAARKWEEEQGYA